MNDQLKERLLKLLQMSKKGVGGEKVNAERMLQRLLQSHGMTMTDIDDESLERQRVIFTYKTKAERNLTIQIVASVMNDDNRPLYSGRISRSVIAELTPSEKAEAIVKHNVWLRAYREELSVFHSAFIMRNNIYPATPSAKSLADLTPAERDKYEKAQRMSRGMDKTNVLNQIGHQS